MRVSALILACCLLFALLTPAPAAAQHVEYRILATNKTSTMQKELNEAADAGYRFGAVMGGETSFGGNEAVVVMQKADGAPLRIPAAGDEQDLDDAEGTTGGG